jgi:hypothetical protein
MNWKLVGALFCTTVMAAAPMMVGTVTAPGAVKIGSRTIPATALSEFPLSLGDKLSTLDEPALIRIVQKAVLRLGPKSTLQLEAAGDKIVIRLLDGTLNYQIADDANVQVYAQERPANPARSGTVKVDARQRKILFLAGAGGAAAVLTTVGLVKRSSNCPPDSPGCGQ